MAPFDLAHTPACLLTLARVESPSDAGQAPGRPRTSQQGGGVLVEAAEAPGLHLVQAGAHRPGTEEAAHVLRVAGEHRVPFADQQAQMPLDHVGGRGATEQASHTPPGSLVQRRRLDPGQHPGEVGLSPVAAPHLTNDRRAGTDRHRIVLGDTKQRPDDSVLQM